MLARAACARRSVSTALAVDQASGRVYAAFSDARAGDADVWVWASPNAGARWADPVRVNDTPAGDATTQTRPQLAVAPGGRVDVVYYDRRADPDDVMTEVSLQSSFDGAATFGPRLALSDRAFDSGIGFGSERGLADLGSRLALLATDTHALAVWADTRAGTEASGKQDLTRALVAFPPPGPLSPATAATLRAAGAAVALIGMLVLLLPALAVARTRRRRDPAAPRPAAPVTSG